MKIGVDIVENRRFKKKLNPIFLAHFLTNKELQDYSQFQNEKAKLNFVCGRWAAKEAVFKTLKPADENRAMRLIEIGYDLNQAPIITTLGLEHVQISISHENNYSVAVALNSQG